ncbi:hypothetical protein VCHENC02_3311B, partial [Vibrio harveyi]
STRFENSLMFMLISLLKLLYTQVISRC